MNQDCDEEVVFKAAIKHDSAERQVAYAKDLCGENADLLARVLTLLKSHNEAVGFLETPILDPTQMLIESPLAEGPGSAIGRYKLLEKIGEGGMAVVYMAEQEKPIRRKVALKIIKLGMDTKQVIARFEAERQALALMDHPNIAKVLDAGATDTGRPFFVMELVTGVSITDYCEKKNLCTKDRLALFIQVCNAVQHAHQKGIIHRDIKPTNIMVTQHEGIPMPKVIDFGVAKATNHRLTEKTLFTRYAHIIGTPAYMSPEQAELSDLDIDTRSDIYSLGVLLYELLTGTTPFSEEELRKAGYLEMTRIIREKEPPRPSTCLTQMLAQSDGHRRLSTSHSQLSADLDWIVMKALEKARDRRYDTASALAVDITRHLSMEPILARPPSTTYRLCKFLRKHRIRVSVALMIIIFALVLMSVLSVWRFRQYQWDIEQAFKARSALLQSKHYLQQEELISSLAAATLALDSKHVDNEARLLVDRIQAAIQDKVQSYNEEIAKSPDTPNNYYFRAKYFKALGEQDKGRADMVQYEVLARGKAAFGPLFGVPDRLGYPVNSPDPSVYEYNPRIHADGLRMTFQRDFDEEMEAWQAMRTKTSGPWETAIRYDVKPGPYLIPGYTTKDGLALYFSSERPGGYGKVDIYVRTRENTDSLWSEPVNLGRPVNTQCSEATTSISWDGLELYFSDHVSPRPGGCGGEDLWVTRRESQEDPWQMPENLGLNVNSTANDTRVHLSVDGLFLFFDSNRPTGLGGTDLYLVRRRSVADPWGEPVNLGPKVNSPDSEYSPAISPDGSTLLFVRNQDIWQVPILSLESEAEHAEKSTEDRKQK